MLDKSDDWKGEHLIRGIKSDSATEAKRVMTRLIQEKRRRAGKPASAAKAHSEWMRWAVYGLRRKKPKAPKT